MEPTIKEPLCVERAQGLVKETILAVCGQEVTWYEGKLELEVIPEIIERLKKAGINISTDAIATRIKYMNQIEMMKRNEDRYLMCVFSDGSTWRMPVAKILERLAAEAAALGDTELSDELRTADRLEAHQIVGYANTLTWQDVRKDAKQLSEAHAVAAFEQEWPSLEKQLMNGSELDRYLRHKHNTGE